MSHYEVSHLHVSFKEMIQNWRGYWSIFLGMIIRMSHLLHDEKKHHEHTSSTTTPGTDDLSTLAQKCLLICIVFQSTGLYLIPYMGYVRQWNPNRNTWQ